MEKVAVDENDRPKETISITGATVYVNPYRDEEAAEKKAAEEARLKVCKGHAHLKPLAQACLLECLGLAAVKALAPSCFASLCPKRHCKAVPHLSRSRGLPMVRWLRALCSLLLCLVIVRSASWHRRRVADTWGPAG